MADEPKIKKSHRTGLYCVLIPKGGATGRQKHQWVSTGERNRARAEAVIAEAGVDRLVLLAKARVLTADAVSIATAGRKFTCADILAAWQTEITGQVSPNTVRIYRQWLDGFIAMIGAERKPIGWIKRPHLDEFVNDGASSRATMHLKRSALRSFYKFANAHAYSLGNLADTIVVRHRDMSFERLEPRITLPLNPDEYQTIQASKIIPVFWKQATALGYWLGLRISDIANLEWGSVAADKVIIHTRKRGRRVELPLDDPLIGSGELRAIVGELLIGTRQDPQYVFPVARQVYLSATPHRLSQDFTRWCERVGILFKSHHSCRHAFVTRLVAAGRTLEQVGRLVGHTNTETTERYNHQEMA